MEFCYGIVRVWQLPVESILSDGVGTLPLAPLADNARGQLPEVVRQMRERLDHEVEPSEADSLWAATYVLMGLRYHADVINALLHGVRSMEDSATYQAIVAEGMAKGLARGIAEGMAVGKAEGAKEVLLEMGTRRFGPPDASTMKTLDGITDFAHIKFLTNHVMEVTSWFDLLKRTS